MLDTVKCKSSFYTSLEKYCRVDGVSSLVGPSPIPSVRGCFAIEADNHLFITYIIVLTNETSAYQYLYLDRKTDRNDSNRLAYALQGRLFVSSSFMYNEPESDGFRYL